MSREAQECETCFASAPLHPRTVVVMPFTNISGNPDDDWLAQGFAETITANLERFSTLPIVWRDTFLSSTLHRPNGQPDNQAALDMARNIGVSWVVTGAFQRVGRQLRITARVISAETATVTQTITVDGRLDDLFALQDRIVEGLGNGFAETTQASTVPNNPPVNTLGPAGKDSGSEESTGLIAGTIPPRGRPLRATPRTPPVPDTSLEARAVKQPEPPVTACQPSECIASEITGEIVLGNSLPQQSIATTSRALNGQLVARPPRTQIVPNVDGRLDDPVWASALHITDFVQLAPLDGAPGTEETEVYVAYDDTHIYLGFYAHYADPSIIRANQTDRDQARGDDAFSVYLDPFLDQQRAYVFTVNPYGVQADSILSAQRSSSQGFGSSRRGFGFSGSGGGSRSFWGAPRGDATWDALFTTGGQFVPDGFTAEMAIPLKSLRYPKTNDDAPQRWGFQIVRRIRGKAETVVWSPVSRAVAGFLTQMGILEGMTDLSTSRNIEILPTFTASQFGSLNDAGSFVDKDTSPEAGINFKYGITSNLTADLTFNPDFSQIESDMPQIDVNERFPLFFPELRPFFLEGAEIFQTLTPVNLVHTRTIVNPRYGAKLTGKTGKTTIGVMYANDETPEELADQSGLDMGPTAQTLVGRVRYDLYSESYVGGIFTRREFGDSYNQVSGLDTNFRLGDTHSFGASVVGSQSRDLDGHETSGYLFNTTIQKAGQNLSYSLVNYALSPDFKTDVGFVRRTDQQVTYGQLSYAWWPENWLVSWGPSVSYMRGYNFKRVLEDERASTGLTFSFTNNIYFRSSIIREMERFGGINFHKTRYNNSGVISTRLFAIGLRVSGGDQIFFDAINPYLGYENAWDTFISVRAISRWLARVNFNTSRFVDSRNNDAQIFNVKIIRALNSYQFTERFLIRNISEYNNFDRRLNLNFLLTYRINAGTVFYVGYDDRYQQADRIERDTNGNGIDDRLFFSTNFRRTNRAVFTKLQYLFRH